MLFNYIEKALYILLYTALIACGMYYSLGCRYWLINDSLSYLSISRQYVEGQAWSAVNSHWSPGFSWLLAFLRTMGLDELYFGRVLLIASIIPTIIVVKNICYETGVNKSIIFCLSVSIALVLFHSALANFTPDMLYIPCLLYLLLQFIRLVKDNNSFNPVYAGIVAAIGFFLKQYMLFYFCGLSFAIIIFFLFNTEIKKYATAASKSLLVFFLAISPWVILISIKARHFTFSTATEYNINLLGNPDKPQVSYMEEGLLPLPYSGAYSYWDVPSALPMEKVSLSEAYSNKSIQFQAGRMFENSRVTYDFADFILNKHLAVIFFICCIVIVFLFYRHNYHYKYYLLCLLAIIVYSAGYIFLVSDYRYTYFIIVGVLLLTAYALNDTLTAIKLPAWLYFIPAILLFYELSCTSIEKVNDFYTEGIQRNQWVDRISAQLEKGLPVCHYESEEQQSTLIYENDFHDHGTLKSNQPLNYRIKELEKYNIYYIISSIAIRDSLQHYLAPVVENDNGIWIYKFKRSR